MKVKIEFEMLNGHRASGVLMDTNGNTVGKVVVGEQFPDEAVREARQDEKRKWFEKVKTREFWDGLIYGKVDGPEGVEYAEEVYDILYELFGEKG